MDATDIRSMTDDELDAAIDDAHQEMFNLRFQLASGQVSDTSRLKAVRRDVARLHTVRRERAIDGARQAQG